MAPAASSTGENEEKPQHAEYAGRSNVIYLTPSEDLGGILAFDRAKIDSNIDMGYEDTIQKFSVGRKRHYI